MLSLPIDSFVPEIVALARERRRVVVSAQPGAGKTTRIPPALTALGRVILLQPRRVAARALARRIAEEQRWTIGDEIGWHIRFERRFGSTTKLLVATEGILTARLHADPLLSGFSVVVLDEFHERSVHADLGLALVKEAAAARGDLAIVVMSATLDCESVSRYLDDAPVVIAPGRLFPIEVSYRPGVPLSAVAAECARSADGDVLCFLPGAGEIRRASAEVESRTSGEYAVLPLHGSLDADGQERALAPSPRKKIILATNIAETSLTVEGVTDVIDSGLEKVLRYDVDRGIDDLVLERIASDSAEQRKGRAGRTRPGRVIRLWDSRDSLRAAREAEISRIDLAGPLLDVIAWGADPHTFGWYDKPADERIDSALELLQMLGAVRGKKVTELGKAVRRLPLHPRLAAMLIASRGDARVAAACAVLSERLPARGAPVASDSDLLSLADDIGRLPPHTRAAARQLQDLSRRVVGESAAATDEEILRAIHRSYADRLARRRDTDPRRFLLASGHGAVLGDESGVRSGEFVVGVELAGAQRAGVSEAIMKIASCVDRSWIVPTHETVEHSLDDGRVRAVRRRYFGAIAIDEHHVAPDPQTAESLLAAELRRRLADLVDRTGDLPADMEPEVRSMRRLRFAGLEADLDAMVQAACVGRTELPRLDLGSRLHPSTRRELDRLAPDSIAVPSGRRARLDYRADGSVFASVKLQELFGLAESPRIGPRQQAVTIELLAPNGRPVQTTRDLRSFWNSTYLEVRRELRGRYPKHPWPDDPWSAKATARTTKRSS